MAFKFERLEVWQQALEISDRVHQVMRGYPRVEMFSLTLLFKRAADSVVLNIAEGRYRAKQKEQRRFVGYSIRSVAECVPCLFLSLRRQYIPRPQFEQL